MQNASFQRQPISLKPGRKFILAIKRGNTDQLVYEAVTFLEYTSSPAVVIVQNNKGQVLRVSRSDLQNLRGKHFIELSIEG